MSRPCTCERYSRDPFADYTADQCRLCWLYHHAQEYHDLWSGRAHCRHFGEAVDLVGCPSCWGRVQLKVFACAVHGRCTPSQPVAGLACCTGCENWAPPPAAGCGGIAP
jgi:hypothetical protein